VAVGAGAAVCGVAGVAVGGNGEGALVGTNGEAVVVGDGCTTIVGLPTVAVIAVGSKLETFWHPASKTAVHANIQTTNWACFIGTL
jgi:hypothetical protein